MFKAKMLVSGSVKGVETKPASLQLKMDGTGLEDDSFPLGMAQPGRCYVSFRECTFSKAHHFWYLYLISLAGWVILPRQLIKRQIKSYFTRIFEGLQMQTKSLLKKHHHHHLKQKK